MKVYLDNAATTPMDNEVIEAMVPVLKEQFGNPSSIHGFGRQVRASVEIARKQIASFLNASPGEICFTSGGTEADNMAIRCAIEDLGLRHAITTKMEHHAVGHTLEAWEKKGMVKISYVNLLSDGHVDLDHLKTLLADNERSFVSLMHANNEIGNLIDLQEVGTICKAYDAIFHSDTVQTIGHYTMDLSETNVDFVTCAAHKFHGPKGVGFLYTNSNIVLKPMIHGGSQERNMRGGTENVYGIVGLAKAMEIAYRDLKAHHDHIQGLKTYMIGELENRIPDLAFNGDAKGRSLYTVLNVCFPQSDKGEMLLFNLDIMGVAASGGSACSSGSDVGSHVLRALGSDPTRPSIRFSFSKFTSREEIDYTVGKLTEFFPVPA